MRKKRKGTHKNSLANLKRGKSRVHNTRSRTKPQLQHAVPAEAVTTPAPQPKFRDSYTTMKISYDRHNASPACFADIDKLHDDVAELYPVLNAQRNAKKSRTREENTSTAIYI